MWGGPLFFLALGAAGRAVSRASTEPDGFHASSLRCMDRSPQNPFAPFLRERDVAVLDGGLATALEDRGHRLDTRLWSAKLLVDEPDVIRSVHRAYLQAGADCITTASYQASFPGFTEAGLTDAEAVELFVRSSELALMERDAFVASEKEGAGRRPLVAASVGPFGAHLADGSEYDGRYGVSPAELDRFHRRRFELLASTGVDVMGCETIPSADEAGVLLDIHAGRPNGTWAWISFVCRDGERLCDGAPFEEAVALVDGCERIAAVGVNCTAPRHVPELVARARSVTDLPLIAYPNSGERYDAATGSWRGPANGEGAPSIDAWLSGVLRAVDAGATVVGGCCRIGPRAISELRRALRHRD